VGKQKEKQLQDKALRSDGINEFLEDGINSDAGTRAFLFLIT